MDIKTFVGLFLAAILVMSAVYPAIHLGEAQEPPQVYVAICIDTEADNDHPMTTQPHETFNISGYLPGGTIEQVFDPAFRSSHTDSWGNPCKISWFMEMDRYIEQGMFQPAQENVSGYGGLLGLMLRYWKSKMELYGDELAYHHHFMDYLSGKWSQVTSLSNYPYHVEAVNHMILDYGFYPVSFRSGWLWEDNELSTWLERFFPFDYDVPFGYGTSWWSGWTPYHPSPTNYQAAGNMSRWATRTLGFAAMDQTLADEAFQKAANGTSTVLAGYCHNWNDMKSLIDYLQGKLRTASTKYGVPFKYCSAKEAIQKFAGTNDFMPPTISIAENGTTYIVKSDERLWNDNLYVALKYADGSYHQATPTYIGGNTWLLDAVSLPEVAEIGVGAVDAAGNPTTRVLNLSPNVILESGNAGSSVVYGDMSKANVSISAPVGPIIETYDGRAVGGEYDFIRRVTVVEPGVETRTDEPLEVFLPFDKGTCYSNDSLCVVHWNGSWVEIPSQVYNVTLWDDGTVKSATVLWNIDVGKGETGQYAVLYDNDGETSAPSYTGLSEPVVVNRGTGFNINTTCGKGDTIKIRGVYSDVEKDVAWINLKAPPSYAAWDDWYIAPGIFHLWAEGEDVFQGGTTAGEANTGPVTEHSSGSNYARKGSAASVSFEVVGPLMVKVRVVYPSKNVGSGGTIQGNFTDVYTIYYSSNFSVTRVKVEHKQELPSAFTEAAWGDWGHLDFPAWDVAPAQTRLAYRRSSGTYSEALTPTAFQGTQHSDWTERWIAMYNDATPKPALGLLFLADSRHTVSTSTYRVMNVGGSGNIWGIHWFPSWSIGATVSGTYNYEFWWVATKTTNPDTVRSEYIKRTNPVTVTVEPPSPSFGSVASAKAGLNTSPDGASLANGQEPEWYNYAFDYRRKLTISETGTGARTGEPVEVFLTFDDNTCYSKDSIRVAYWNVTWTEVPSQVYNVSLWPSGKLKSATVLWLANIGLNETRDYYLYFDKNGEVPPPAYTGLSLPRVENRGTAFNLATPYGTGDTMKLRATFQGVEKDVVWINLKQPSSYVAWDDWYIAPGIFHLWAEGEDVFQGGTTAGEANTGPVTEHSNGVDYARKGSATQAVFEIVGPLMTRIRVVFPSQNTGSGKTIPATFTDTYSVYYTPDFKVTRIKVEQKQEFVSSFNEAPWGDWTHLDFPAWDVTPAQTKIAYRRASGTYSEALTPTAFQGTQHSDWTERWIAMYNDATPKPALGLFFTRDDRHTISTTTYRIMNAGGSGSIWGIHWFPSWSIGATVSGTYNYEFWWVATKTTNPDTTRNEYLKTLSPLVCTVGNVEPAVEPSKYSLTLESSPVTADFLLDGVTRTTNLTLMLFEGEHVIVMPANCSADALRYDFVRWADGYTNRTRTVNLGQNTTLLAEYSLHYEVVTVDSEYLFSGLVTAKPDSLNFTVSVSYNASSVNVTIQVYDFSSSSYMTAGEGFLAYISSETLDTEETHSLIVTVDPQRCTLDGNAKLKITGVKNTTSAFTQKVNLPRLEVSHSTLDYDYVLRIVNPAGKSDKTVALSVTASSDIERIESLNATFYDGQRSSDQIVIVNGLIVRQSGDDFQIPSGHVLRLKVSAVNANASGTTTLYMRLTVSIPNTTRLRDYVVNLFIDPPPAETSGYAPADWAIIALGGYDYYAPHSTNSIQRVEGYLQARGVPYDVMQDDDIEAPADTPSPGKYALQWADGSPRYQVLVLIANSRHDQTATNVNHVYSAIDNSTSAVVFGWAARMVPELLGLSPSDVSFFEDYRTPYSVDCNVKRTLDDGLKTYSAGSKITVTGPYFDHVKITTSLNNTVWYNVTRLGNSYIGMMNTTYGKGEVWYNALCTDSNNFLYPNPTYELSWVNNHADFFGHTVNFMLNNVEKIDLGLQGYRKWKGALVIRLDQDSHYGIDAPIDEASLKAGWVYDYATCVLGYREPYECPLSAGLPQGYVGSPSPLTKHGTATYFRFGGLDCNFKFIVYNSTAAGSYDRMRLDFDENKDFSNDEEYQVFGNITYEGIDGVYYWCYIDSIINPSRVNFARWRPLREAIPADWLQTYRYYGATYGCTFGFHDWQHSDVGNLSFYHTCYSWDGSMFVANQTWVEEMYNRSRDELAYCFGSTGDGFEANQITLSHPGNRYAPITRNAAGNLSYFIWEYGSYGVSGEGEYEPGFYIPESGKPILSAAFGGDTYASGWAFDGIVDMVRTLYPVVAVYGHNTGSYNASYAFTPYCDMLKPANPRDAYAFWADARAMLKNNSRASYRGGVLTIEFAAESSMKDFVWRIPLKCGGKYLNAVSDSLSSGKIKHVDGRYAYIEFSQGQGPQRLEASYGTNPHICSLSAYVENLTQVYTDKRLTLQLWNNSGAVTVQVNCVALGQPSLVLVNGVPASFAYNTSTNVCVFDVVLGSPKTADIVWQSGTSGSGMATAQTVAVRHYRLSAALPYAVPAPAVSFRDRHVMARLTRVLFWKEY